ncbi:hypothetical protein J7K70_02150 [bacterium]|nr:hypothetical protein [bacterium]
MNNKIFQLFLFSLLIGGIIGLSYSLVRAQTFCESFCDAHQDTLNYESCLNYCNGEASVSCQESCTIEGVFNSGCFSTCLANKMDSYLNSEGNTGELVIENPLGPTSDIWQLIMKIIDFVFNIAIFVAAIIIVYAGFTYITSSGEPKKVAQAQKILIWALIGFAVVLIAKSIPPFIYKFLTGKSLNSNFSSESYSSPASPSVSYPTSPITGGYVYNSTTDTCIWDDNALADSPECVDDLIP